MTEFENTIIKAATEQKQVRNCEVEGSIFQMEKDLVVLLTYNAIGDDCYTKCIEILLS